MKTLSRDLTAVGLIVKVFGIKGDVIVKPTTDDPGRFRRLRKVFVARLPLAGAATDRPQESALTVERASVKPQGVRVKLGGIDDRTAASRIVGSYLCVQSEERVRLPEGSFFVHDIVGLRVVDAAGEAIGVVKEVLRLPANDVYIVDHSGREVMIPAVGEFVKKVDLASGSMVVSLIEGMLEE